MVFIGLLWLNQFLLYSIIYAPSLSFHWQVTTAEWADFKWFLYYYYYYIKGQCVCVKDDPHLIEKSPKKTPKNVLYVILI